MQSLEHRAWSTGQLHGQPDYFCLVWFCLLFEVVFYCLVEGILLFCSPLHTQEVFQENPQVLNRVIHDTDSAAALPFKSARPF